MGSVSDSKIHNFYILLTAVAYQHLISLHSLLPSACLCAKSPRNIVPPDPALTIQLQIILIRCCLRFCLARCRDSESPAKNSRTNVRLRPSAAYGDGPSQQLPDVAAIPRNYDASVVN